MDTLVEADTQTFCKKKLDSPVTADVQETDLKPDLTVNNGLKSFFSFFKKGIWYLILDTTRTVIMCLALNYFLR